MSQRKTEDRKEHVFRFRGSWEDGLAAGQRSSAPVISELCRSAFLSTLAHRVTLYYRTSGDGSAAAWKDARKLEGT